MKAIVKTVAIALAIAAMATSASAANITFGNVLFTQDFSISNTLSDYVNSTGETNKLSHTAVSGGTVSIDNGQLKVYAGDGSGKIAMAGRMVDFTPTPEILKMEFDLTSVAGASASGTSLHVRIGNGLTTSATDDNNTSGSTAGVKAVNNAVFGLTDTGFSINSLSFTGQQRITIVANKTGAAVDYLNPAGVTESLANNKYDIFVGSTRVRNEEAFYSTFATLSEFKFRVNGDDRGALIDNIVVSTVPEPATMALLGLGGMTAIFRRRRA